MRENFVFVAGHNGVKTLVVNTTPHPLTFIDHEGAVVEVPNAPDFLLNARAEEVQVEPGLVTTKFVNSDAGLAVLVKIEEEVQNLQGLEKEPFEVRIVGSIIAAQAYPGRVVAMTPAPGYERVAPAEKRMSTEKFTVFLK